MSALEAFQSSIGGAKNLIDMYKEIRRSRGLNMKGRIGEENEDLLWLPRSAIVISISSLDAYIHRVLHEEIPRLLSQDDVPQILLDDISKVVRIRNGKDVEKVIKLMRGDSVNNLFDLYYQERLSQVSFQSPDKIALAFRFININDVFGRVSALWQGDNSDEDSIKRRLANYVHRRNQIAHEGDLEKSGKVRHIQATYVNHMVSFVESLVNRLNQVVYPQ